MNSLIISSIGMILGVTYFLIRQVKSLVFGRKSGNYTKISYVFDFTIILILGLLLAFATVVLLSEIKGEL